LYKTAGLALCAAAAALTLSACATGHGGYGVGYGPGPGPGYDTYYDGFYGDINDGYWGPDQAFYYHGPDGHYVRDNGNHFRHQSFSGAHGLHAGHPPQ
jgi:hypothetical protein